MTMNTADRLMTVSELAEMLGVPVTTPYGLSAAAKAHPDIASAATSATAAPRLLPG